VLTITLADGIPLSISLLLASEERRLPAVKEPDAWERMPELPRNPVMAWERMVLAASTPDPEYVRDAPVETTIAEVVFTPDVTALKAVEPAPPEQVPAPQMTPLNEIHCPGIAPAWVIWAGDIIADWPTFP
jgi:hypothetical protein